MGVPGPMDKNESVQGLLPDQAGCFSYDQWCLLVSIGSKSWGGVASRLAKGMGTLWRRFCKGSPLQDDGNHPVIFDNQRTNRKS